MEKRDYYEVLGVRFLSARLFIIKCLKAQEATIWKKKDTAA